MVNLTLLNLRDVIGADACYVDYSFDGLRCFVILGNPTIKTGAIFKTYYEDRYGYLQVGFDVIAKDGGVFVIKAFENHYDDGLDLKFEWKDCGDGDFIPQFIFYEKSSVFDGDLIESWAFVDKDFVKSDNFQVKVDVLSNEVKLERAAAANA